MSNTNICFAGLSREEEAQVTAVFQRANSRLGGHWTLTPENAAGVLVIDMDSMYGQMSLMKAIGSGQVLVALTAGGRAETDYVLTRPVTDEALADLMARIDSRPAREPVASNAGEPAPAADPAPAAAPAPAPIPAAERVTGPTPVVPAAPVVEQAAAPAAPAAEPAATPAVAPKADPRLADLLRPGALSGPVRLQLDGAPDLVLDPASQTYLAGQALKPLLPHCAATIKDTDLQPVAAADLPAIAASVGGSQPWSRLAWLCALSSGNGALMPGYGLNDKYKLLKWPQTEREFPKHFRIATVMMKGPANLTEIATLSTTPLGEVMDYVNACLASGVAEPDAVAPAPADAAKGGGLLGRFRR
ncbi:MAG: hypothetical protein K0M70_04760 [Arenimonas sp.]|uniref:hypothetical protein n=1 Tax=Arenimonas sp. TaxID=1872635 RepID=UPI0025B9625F|nr:hypothetical protein [Arenimonas sp.]MBW8367153.1 hypothetical protein [Arenimonas sp.]